MVKYLIPFVFLVLLSSALMLSQTSCVAQKNGGKTLLKGVVAPFDVQDIRARLGRTDKRSFTCPEAPVPVVKMLFNSVYDKSSENSSVVDPEEKARYLRETENISMLETGLSKYANRYVMAQNPNPQVAQCVVDWINIWAMHDGLLGESNRMGEFVRKWALSSISLAYLQVKDEPSLSEEDKAIVRFWIRRLAERVVADFSTLPKISSRNNNHMYWAGWGVACASVVLDDRELLNWGIEAARIGIRQVQNDGTLPLELSRGPKAFMYHQYAAIPLMMTAALAKKNGVDLFDENDEALRRLGQVIIRNIADQGYFEELTGEKQNLERAVTTSNLTWLEPYYAFYHDPAAEEWLEKFRPVKHSRVGGNATNLYGPGEKEGD